MGRPYRVERRPYAQPSAKPASGDSWASATFTTLWREASPTSAASHRLDGRRAWLLRQAVSRAHSPNGNEAAATSVRAVVTPESVLSLGWLDAVRQQSALAWADHGTDPLLVPTHAADERSPRAIDVAAPPRVAQMSGALPGGGHQVPFIRSARRAWDLASSDRLALEVGRKARIDRSSVAVLKQHRVALDPSMDIGQNDEPDPRRDDAAHTLTIR